MTKGVILSGISAESFDLQAFYVCNGFTKDFGHVFYLSGHFAHPVFFGIIALTFRAQFSETVPQ
ncbi:hypothetical protein [Marinospirillum sp.]|uniref:hypothetical protein n=1 Tax=Marinospirillum sp. TaxID=2183934 RepID=UPI003A8AA73E